MRIVTVANYQINWHLLSNNAIYDAAVFTLLCHYLTLFLTNWF